MMLSYILDLGDGHICPSHALLLREHRSLHS